MTRFEPVEGVAPTFRGFYDCLGRTFGKAFSVSVRAVRARKRGSNPLPCRHILAKSDDIDRNGRPQRFGP